jgi:hypothetical protein
MGAGLVVGGLVVTGLGWLLRLLAVEQQIVFSALVGGLGTARTSSESRALPQLSDRTARAGNILGS